MLENLRDKIINVQQDLSASLRSLTTGESSSFRSIRTTTNRNCNLNAGADILHHYQCKWEDLHNIAEENAKTAENIDKLIGDIHKYSEEKLNGIQQLNSQLSLLPKLHTSIQALMTKIGELEGLFEEVESSVLYLEDMIETQELQEKQLDYRFQLALFQKKKLAEYEQTKVKLAGEHACKVLEFEQKQKSVLQERQEAFREAFEEEMHHYKTHGHIEKIPSSSSGNCVVLSDINLETDHTDLDAFLAEEATEDSFIPVSDRVSSEETDASTDVEKI